MFKNFFKDAVIYGMAVAIAKLLLFLSIPLFTSAMSVEDYGVISFIGSLIGLIGIVMKIGMNNAVQRYYFDVSEDFKTNIISSGLKVLFTFSSLVLFAFLVLAILFKEYFNAKEISLTVLFLAMIYIFLLQYIIFIKDVMRLYFKPWIYFILEISPVILSLFLALLFIVYFDFRVEGYFLGYTIGTFIIVMGSFYFLREKILFKEKTKFKKELISFGYPFIFVGLASWVFQSSDRWMLLELTNAKEVGLYSVAYQVSSILLLFVTTFGIVWSPYSMKLLRNERHRDIYALVGVIWYILLSYIAFVVSLFFSDIITVLLDVRYYGSIEIGLLLVITILSIGTVQISLMGIAISKKTTVLPWITWSVAFVNIMLNYLLIPEYFAFGAAMSTLISNVLLTVVYFWFSQKFYYIPFNKIKFLFITIFIIVFYTILFFYNIYTIMFLYKIIVCFFLSIVFIYWIIYEVKKVVKMVNNEK